jgi:hypothetical protein
MGLRTAHNLKLPSYIDPQQEVDALRVLLKATIQDLADAEKRLVEAKTTISFLMEQLESQKNPVTYSGAKDFSVL